MANLVPGLISDIDCTSVSQALQCTVEEFSRLITRQGDILNIIHINIRSIHKNFNEFITLLANSGAEFDLIILTECWLGISTIVPTLKGYLSHQIQTPRNQNDGVVLYYKENTECFITERPLCDGSCLVYTIGNEIAIVSIYRSPANNNTESFRDSLELVLSDLKSYNTISLIGDVNIDIKDNNKDKNSEEYLTLMATHGLLPAHTFPTHDNNCLDHIFLKTNKFSSNFVIDAHVTDHSPIVLCLECSKHKAFKPPKTRLHMNYEAIQTEIEKCDFSPIYTSTDVNTATNFFISMLSSIVKKHTSTVKISRKKELIKPWMTPGLLRCLRNRDTMHRKVKKKPNDLILKLSYKRYRNFCVGLLRKLKAEYDKQELDKVKNNPKALWAKLKELSGTSKSSSGATTLLKSYSSPELAVQSVNEYFAHIGENLANAIRRTSINEAKHTGCFTNNNSLVIMDVDHGDVGRIILTLRDDCAVGWDGISARILKNSINILVPLITHICNLSIHIGTFPKPFKKAIIHPIYKSGDRDSVGNYRPISVLPTLSKILEKTLNKSLVNFLDRYDLIAANQFGFRKKVSCEDAVIALTSSVVEGLDRRRRCIGIFLDLSKAFDTVSVPVLLKKMEVIGIRDLNIFSDYLRDRTQCTKIDNYVSDEQELSYGVPQGSILGPTLFQIYINDLCKLSIPSCKIFTYADDTALLIDGSSWEDAKINAENCLKVVMHWLAQNLLTLNISKSHFITFKLNKSQHRVPDFPIVAHTCTDSDNCNCLSLTKVTQTKYLGVVIDDKLTWHQHVSVLKGRVRKVMAVFKKLRHAADFKVLIMVYQALTESLLTYCNTVWGGTDATALLTLERAQRSVLKVMLSKPIRYRTYLLYADCKVLTVRQLYILRCILRRHLSVPTTANQVGQKRKCRDVCPITKHRTHFASRNFDILSCAIYNRLNKTLDLRDKNLHACKTLVKQYLLTLNYEETENLIHADIL